jgi:hypothetical protein
MFAFRTDFRQFLTIHKRVDSDDWLPAKWLPKVACLDSTEEST